MTPQKMTFENIVGKGENAGNQHFLLFPTMISTLLKASFKVLATLKFCRLQMLSIPTSLKFCCLVKR